MLFLPLWALVTPWTSFEMAASVRCLCLGEARTRRRWSRHVCEVGLRTVTSMRGRVFRQGVCMRPPMRSYAWEFLRSKKGVSLTNLFDLWIDRHSPLSR